MSPASQSALIDRLYGMDRVYAAALATFMAERDLRLPAHHVHCPRILVNPKHKCGSECIDDRWYLPGSDHTMWLRHAGGTWRVLSQPYPGSLGLDEVEPFAAQHGLVAEFFGAAPYGRGTIGILWAAK